MHYLTREKYRRHQAKIAILAKITANIDTQFRTQRDAAKEIGCHQSTISNWHNNKGGSLPLIAVAMEVLDMEVKNKK